ncbi:ATP-binding protein, partial [Paenibacillus tundrae]
VNLLNNGLQAAASDHAAVFHIRLRAEEDNLFVNVQDNGTGITKDDQPKIFERFYRGEIKKRRTRGLGLGLTYSRLLARAQGGELSLTSSSPEGSLFTLTLPRWSGPEKTEIEPSYRATANA